MFRERLLSECREAACDTVILSSEHCSSRLLYPDEIERVRDLLSALGAVEILVYLRRQDELWASRYSTAVKGGSTERIGLPTPQEKKALLDYHDLCLRWTNLFGAANFTVRIFDRRDFIGQDLLEDFLHAANLQIEPSALKRPERQNIGLDPRLLEFLRRFNAHLPHVSRASGFRPDPRQGNLLPILEKLSSEKHGGLPAAWSREIMNEFRAGNSVVADTFCGRNDGRLFRDEAPVADAGDAVELTIDDAFEIFARIWAEKNQPDPAENAKPARRERQ
jgi:hypothetical protein